MSDEYAEGNDESTMQLFFKRINYLIDANNNAYYEDEQNLIDFGWGEKRLYGRVNRHYVPVILNTAVLPLSYLATRPNNQAGFRVVEFVAKAFEDLRLQFQKHLFDQSIRPGEKYLSDIVPAKAYEDPQQLYYEYSLGIESVLEEYYVTHNIKFRDFDEFLNHYKASLRRMAPNFPFTFPAYVKSWRCPMTVSGLVIEIADLNHADDEEKMEVFVNSPNWSFYLNACRSYGFSVDRRSPWRLVADIASKPMLEYARQSGMSSTDAILVTGYTSAPAPFYRGFKNYLLRNYNKLKANQYMETELCGTTGRTITTTITPFQYTEDELLHRYGEEFFLKLYFEIRIIEEEKNLTKDEQMRLIEQSLNLYELYHNARNLSKSDAADEVVRNFERIINSTYDYSGSLTDITRRVMMIEDQPPDQME
tara:strand:- start:1322 stop:2584 length:1263 start_codon:yes stop_codon:yes gene_type:complete